MPAHDDPPGGGMAEWALELERVFAVRVRGGSPAGKGGFEVKGIGTPALKQLLAEFLGEDSVTDDAFIAFFTAAADQEDPTILDPDERREQRALAIGGSAWLFAPRVESSDFDLLFPVGNGKRLKGSPTTIDTLATRKAWAYSHYLTALSGSSTLVKGSSKSGDTFRTKFRDALLAALSRHLDAVIPSGNSRKERVIPLTARALALRPELHRFVATAAESLDQPPTRTYPSSMRPSRMSASTTISRAHDVGRFARTEPSALYIDNAATQHGDPGVATLVALRRGVLLGDPGTGKSTLLKATFLSHVSADEGALGVFARLTTLGELLDHNPPRTPQEAVGVLIDAGEQTMGFALTPDQRHQAIDLFLGLPDGVLVALDGLDEVLDQRQLSHIETALQRLEPTPIRILITSRIAGYRRTPLEATEYVVDRLGDEQLEEFFGSWFEEATDPDGRVRLDTALAASPELRRLVEIPVMATFAAFVAELGDVPTRVTDLYQAYIGRYLQHEWKDPGQRRVDPVEIADLTDAAARLAWAMATRPASSPHVEDSWTDVASMQEILAMVPTDRDDIRQLLTVDGLLTPHGTGDSSTLLSQQYRWIHRTLHEHLAGQYISRWFLDDAAGALAFIRLAAQRPRTWQQPLAHAFGLLPPQQQAEVAEHLTELATAGDPGAAIRSTLATTHTHAHEAVLRRDADYRQTVRARIKHTDDVLARRRIFLGELEVVADKGELERLFYMVVDRLVVPDAELLERYLRRALDVAPDSYSYRDALNLYGKFDPDGAIEILLESHRRAPSVYGGGLDYAWQRWTVSPSMLESIYAEATRHSELVDCLRFVTLLVHLPGGAELLTTKPPIPHIVEAAALADRYLQHFGAPTPEQITALTPLWRGERGDLAACLAGGALFAADWAKPLENLLSGWALVMYRINQFATSGPDAVGLVRRSDEDLIAILDAYVSSRDSFDLAKVTELVDAVRQLWLDGCAPGVLVTLLRLCGRVTDAFEPKYWPERPRAARHDITYAVRDVLYRIPWDRVWIAIQIVLPTAPEPDLAGYRSVAGFLVTQSDGLSQDDLEQRARQVFDWGAQHNFEVASLVPTPAVPSEFLAEQLETGRASYLARPDNFQKLAEWLRDEGSLPYWRERLLQLSASAQD